MCDISYIPFYVSKLLSKINKIFDLSQRAASYINETGQFRLASASVALDYICRN